MSWRIPKIIELSAKPVDKLLEELRTARATHIDIVNNFNNDRFNHPMTSFWSTGGDGTRLESPGWVATKTSAAYRRAHEYDFLICSFFT